MDTKSIIVGRIGHSYGLQGFFKIRLTSCSPQDFLSYKDCFIVSRGNHLPLLDCQTKGNFLIGKIKDCHSPEAVKKYANANIRVNTTDLPKLSTHEYYWTDLIGLNVYTLDNIYLGTIDSLLETGANDVMVIKNPKDNKEILIPYVMKKIIRNIDLQHKTMQVDWSKDW